MSQKKPPHAKTSPRPREGSLRAITLGLFLAITLGAANAYLGLYAGMTVGASVPAAVISMAILRGLFKNGTILENNIVQTIASTGESLAAGVIFTIPALLIAGVWTEIDFAITTAICITGGMLGILFMIPLRKAHIIDEPSLVYPEGQACAAILQSGESLSESKQYGGVIQIFLGVMLGGVLKFFQSGYKLLTSSFEAATSSGSSVFMVGFDLSAALIGVGYIVGTWVCFLIAAGGVIGWFIGIPLLSGDALALWYTQNPGASLNSGELVGIAFKVWSTKIRYIGVGALIVGGIWSIFNMRKNLLQSLISLRKNYLEEKAGTASQDPKNQDMKSNHILVLLGITAVAIFVLYYVLTDGYVTMSLVATFASVLFSFLFVAVASYICGLVGSSNSPVSGMTISAVLGMGLLVLAFGLTGPAAILATLGVAGVVCCAACTAGDIAQDLKTGNIVGATPRTQQWCEILGAVVPAFFMAPILILLHSHYGIGTDAPDSLKAPQAALFASLVKGIFGTGEVPWDMVAHGAKLGVFIGLVDLAANYFGFKKKIPIMPIAIGLYLPIGLSTTILIGGLILWGSKKGAGLLAAGLIAGESLVGVLVAALFYFVPWLMSETPSGYPSEGLTLAFIFGLIIILFFAKGSQISKQVH